MQKPNQNEKFMTSNLEVSKILLALDEAKARVPKCMEELFNYEDNFEVHILEIELGIEKPLSERLGVSKSLFPDADQLEDDEISLIVEKILNLWAVYHYLADLPHGLPIRIAYRTLLSVWDEQVLCLSTGHFHFDFCDQDLDQYVDPSLRNSFDF